MKSISNTSQTLENQAFPPLLNLSIAINFFATKYLSCRLGISFLVTVPVLRFSSILDRIYFLIVIGMPSDLSFNDFELSRVSMVSNLSAKVRAFRPMAIRNDSGVWINAGCLELVERSFEDIIVEVVFVSDLKLCFNIDVRFNGVNLACVLFGRVCILFIIVSS